MARDVDDAAADIRSAGAFAALVLWAGIAADLAVTVLVQWLRTGWPVLAASSIGGAIAATRVAANMRLREPLPVPASAHDRDMMTLMLLTGTVLLVIVATILFTFWFSRPMFRRHRR
jgi:methylglyoxal synthase